MTAAPQTPTSATPKRTMKDSQKNGLTSLAVLYRIGHCGDELSRFNLSSDASFVEPHLRRMEEAKLLEMKGTHYALTAKGEDLLEKMKQKTFEGVQTFEVFAGVDMDRDLTEEEQHEDQVNCPGEVKDHLLDPHFREATATEELMGKENGLIDMRLAMVIWLAEQGKMDCDPFEIVFLQKLTQGYFDGARFWAKLEMGLCFEEVEGIVNGVYQWRQMSAHGEEDASMLMATLFKAGMNQNKKLAGDTCGGCGAPIGMFEDDLECCPACGKDLGVGEEEELVEDDGEVVETTVITEEEEVMTSESDGFLDYYEPDCGIWYVDPYDAVAVAATCAVLGTCLYSDPYYW